MFLSSGDQLELWAQPGAAMMPAEMLERKNTDLLPVDVALELEPTTSSPSDVFCKFCNTTWLSCETEEKNWWGKVKIPEDFLYLPLWCPVFTSCPLHRWVSLSFDATWKDRKENEQKKTYVFLTLGKQAVQGHPSMPFTYPQTPGHEVLSYVSLLGFIVLHHNTKLIKNKKLLASISGN